MKGTKVENKRDYANCIGCNNHSAFNFSTEYV